MINSGKVKSPNGHHLRLMSACFFLFTVLNSGTPAFGASVPDAPGSSYIGASRCGNCHVEKYESWKQSGHAAIMRSADSSEIEAMPLPEGYTLEDLSYVIGGFRWKALYLDKMGYLVTGASGAHGSNQSRWER